MYSSEARFGHEARAIAALNHTSICHLYDVGPNYLMMEPVEGPTLADRIAQGPIPFDEAIDIARQIADALEAAHEKGIVHRDLKPGNVKITPEGTVKVLDFGLAKLGGTPVVQSDHSPTITAAPTQAGGILGTAGYMSPEQAKGRPVDKRADIWAFGVLLYEMLSGKRLFAGDTVTETLAAVLEREPKWEEVPARARPLRAAAWKKIRRSDCAISAGRWRGSSRGLAQWKRRLPQRLRATPAAGSGPRSGLARSLSAPCCFGRRGAPDKLPCPCASKWGQQRR